MAAVGSYWHLAQYPAWSDFQIPVANTQASLLQQDLSSTLLPTTGEAKLHAAALIPLLNGNVMAFWFAGSREGANDVVIQSAVFDHQAQTWSMPITTIDRVATQQGLWRYISKLGNPVPVRAANGQLQLYFVTVSVGGWATSSITVITSVDEGVTWSAPQRLITSPLLNLSTLVKSSAIMFADERIGLPVYHELAGKFGELLRIESGTDAVRLLDKRRMSAGRGSLQPVIFVDSAKNATTYLRQAREDHLPQRIPSSYTVDAGHDWQIGADLPLANPNAAIAGLQLSTGDRVLVLNDLEHGRYRLVLAMSRLQSKDGISTYSDWQVVKTLEDDSAIAEDQRRRFSYPYLITDVAGDVHLVYTFNSDRIKHVRFKTSYLHALALGITDE